MRVCECVCILPIYDPRSDRSEHIYNKIHGKNHSSAHSRTIFHGRIKIITTPLFFRGTRYTLGPWSGTLLGRFSIINFRGLGLRVRVWWARWPSGSERWLGLVTGQFPAGFEPHCGKTFRFGTLAIPFTPIASVFRMRH